MPDQLRKFAVVIGAGVVVVVVAVVLFVQNAASSADDEVRSSLRNAAVGMEQAFGRDNPRGDDRNTYPADVAFPSATVSVTVYLSADGYSYCLEATPSGRVGSTQAYDSTEGGLLGPDTTCEGFRGHGG